MFSAKFECACANNSTDVMRIGRAREFTEVSGNALGSRGGEFVCNVTADFSPFSRLHAIISVLIVRSVYNSTKWYKYRTNTFRNGEINSFCVRPCSCFYPAPFSTSD